MHEVDAAFLKKAGNRLVLNPFSDDGHIKLVGKINHCADKAPIFNCMATILHKGSCNFYHVDVRCCEVSQTRAPHAKIIYSNFSTPLAQG